MIGHHGFFSTRLKYLKGKLNDLNTPAVDDVSNQMDELQLSPEDDLLFLKNCVIKNADRNVIIAKLKSTQHLRESMMQDVNIDVRESFPFFFAEPSLV